MSLNVTPLLEGRDGPISPTELEEHSRQIFHVSFIPTLDKDPVTFMSLMSISYRWSPIR